MSKELIILIGIPSNRKDVNYGASITTIDKWNILR